MNLNQWAIKWGIPAEAMADYRVQFGMEGAPPAILQGESEAAIQSRVRLEASQAGGRLWRNNVFVLKDERGVPVRAGLCNETKEMNGLLKSSDLIGILPVEIMPHHLGTTIGQFAAREVKEAGWQYTGTDREIAQLNFMQLVTRLGGNASFANNTGSILTP